MSLLVVDRLSVHFGARPALEPVSLAVAAGEVVALVGPSGSGKSTLALAIAGLLPPAAQVAGTVRLDGVDLATLDEAAWRRVRGGRIGLVFQEPATALNPALTIGRQIGETLVAHGWRGRRVVAAEVRSLLDRVGLDMPADRYPHQLSGGQRQRVAIAIAIAAGPALLIADEPTAALDPAVRDAIMALLVGLVRERGMGLLLISHDHALVDRVADRVVALAEEETGRAGPTVAPLPSGPPRRPMPAAGEAPLLTVEGASKRFGTAPGLDRVSLTIEAGETVALVGPSGSGKSTLARLILGLDRPDAGRVLFRGQPIERDGQAARRARRRAVQAVFQDPATSFDPRFTVERIVAEPLALLDPVPNRAERRALVEGALAEVGLPADASDRRPAAFSGGQRQRIAIARALILRPALVVLDEAVSALDPALRADIVSLLAHLQERHGLSYLFVSHDMDLVRAIAHRTLVLDKGRLAADESAALPAVSPAGS